VTAKGIKALAQGWAEQAAEERTDLDSILRVTFLAWQNGSATACQEFLKRSADGLRGWSGSIRAEAERLAGKVEAAPDANTFLWMNKHCEAARAESDAAALNELSAQIGKRSGAKRRTDRAKRTQ
jgi:hypothetical protein